MAYTNLNQMMSIKGAPPIVTKTDQETGCVSRSNDTVAYEMCRQVYFTKQQNSILQSQNSSTTQENANLKSQVLTMQHDIAVSENQHVNQFEMGGVFPVLLVVISGIAFYAGSKWH